MPIRITSQKDGFRRCGMAHPMKTTEYPDEKFSKEQVKILKNESMLMVEVIGGKSGKEKKNTKESLMAYTLDALKEMGKKHQCKETTKEKLVDEILAAQAKEN